MSQRETQGDLFRRALVQSTRALAGKEELEVTFGAEGPRMTQGRIVLPHPPRHLNTEEAARIRGAADALALRLAYHDDASHKAVSPPGANAREVFDAVEDQRVQAIGANALAGVGSNLEAALIDKYERKGFMRMADRASAPMADALAMMLRERLTGRAPPDVAKGVVNIWRAEIEAKAGAVLNKLAAAKDDQKQFAQISKQLIRALDMGDELGEQDAEDDESQESDDEPQPDSSDDGDQQQEEEMSSESQGAQQDDSDDDKGQAAKEIEQQLDENEESDADDEAARPMRPQSRNNGDAAGAEAVEWIHAQDAPIARDQSGSSTLPLVAFEGGWGDWILGAGAMTSAVSERAHRYDADKAQIVLLIFPSLGPGLVDDARAFERFEASQHHLAHAQRSSLLSPAAPDSLSRWLARASRSSP